MKEVIYIQAGHFANYVGTHFWNTQESYFTYEEGEESEVDHDVSFREGLSLKGDQTYCPRLLVFDRKVNFGTLSAASGLYGDDEEESAAQVLSTWGGGVVEYRQERMPKSRYQQRLDDEAQDADKEISGQVKPVSDTDIRYWSDFNRVFLHPRTLQRLPDLADWESAEGDWYAGKDVFERHVSETDLMEESLRQFIEECDNIQGLQVINDTGSFGGFTNAFLTSFRDDFPKLPCLAFPLLSSAVSSGLDPENDLAMRKVVNDALFINSLDGLATMTVPIHSPETWAAGEWLEGISLNRNSTHQTSAVLSAHIESVTLPLRLKGSAEDLASVCGTLNWGGGNRFAHLSGMLPLPPSLVPERDFDRKIHDFSVQLTTGSKVRPATVNRYDYARIYVSRGFSSFDRRQLDQWTESQRPLPQSIYAPAYPIPTSFPSFFTSPPAPSPAQPAHPSRVQNRLPSTRMLSSLHTTPQTSRFFGAYASAVDKCARLRPDVLGAMGVEKDEVRELRDGLWALRDEYAGADDSELEAEAETLGEDEE